MLAIHQDELSKLDATAALLKRIGEDVWDMREIRAAATVEAERLVDMLAKAREFVADDALIDEARELARVVEDEEDRISFDDHASTSPSDEGTFVSCWFWVPSPADEEEA